MSKKEIVVAFYGRRFLSEVRPLDFDPAALTALFDELAHEFAPFGVKVGCTWEEEVVLDVKGYGDLLNCVRLRSPSDGIANLCLGHVIGPSPNLNLFDDIRRGVSRIAFAPEMVEPEGENKRVCHNCGCGC